MGEYTGSKSYSTPFRIEDILFSCDHSVFTATSTEVDLQATTFMTLTFTTQNNGGSGKKIFHKAPGDQLLLPKAALLWRVLHLRSNNETPSTPPARVMTPTGRWNNIIPTMISKTLNTSVILCISKLGFVPDLTATSSS